MEAEFLSLDLANRVRSRRLAAGLSQQALAAHCAITRQAIHAIEVGRYVPNTAVALRLARALGCTVEALFSLPDAPERIQAEVLAAPDGAGAAPCRVQVARVGDRVLARPLQGGMATTLAADGLALGSGRAAMVELLVPLERLEHAVVVQGCDPALALLGAHLARRYPAFRLVWASSSSLAALRALARGEVHAAGAHLLDPESGESNLPAIRRELGGRDLIVVTLSEWQQGLIVAPGNPKGIADVRALARPDVTIVNREPGAGSRMLLDAWLAAAAVPPSAVRGYGHAAPSHQAVAEAVAAGAADAGPGILAVARALGLGFVPLQIERYDLVIPRPYFSMPGMQGLLDTLVSGAYRRELAALGGYDTAQAGAVVAELAS